MYQKCQHCGRSFNTDLIDIDRHEENCKRHLGAVVSKNIVRVNAGKRPKRRP